jgi:hypothetical protein
MEQLDPVSLAFARLSLNVTLASMAEPPELFLSARVHVLLISLLSFEEEFVVGPALMALAHLSLLDPLKPEIVGAGALKPCLVLAVNSTSVPILIQVCKLVGSLALLSANRTHICESGLVHALLDLVEGSSKLGDVDEHISDYACRAIANLTHKCYSNKRLVADSKGVPPILKTISFFDRDRPIIAALKAVANVAYFHPFGALSLLEHKADAVIIDLLDCTDIRQHAELIEACACIICAQTTCE